MSISRRKIIQSIGIVTGMAATGTLSAATALAVTPDTISNNNIFGKYGLDAILIGAGARSRTFSRFAKENPDKLRLTAVVDPESEHRDRIQSKHDLSSDQCFAHWKKAFASTAADVAIISMASDCYEVCAAALRAGFHVWVDSPVSIDKEKIDDINAIARRCGRQLLYCYIYPHDTPNFVDHRYFEKPVPGAAVKV